MYLLADVHILQRTHSQSHTHPYTRLLSERAIVSIPSILCSFSMRTSIWNARTHRHVHKHSVAESGDPPSSSLRPSSTSFTPCSSCPIVKSFMFGKFEHFHPHNDNNIVDDDDGNGDGGGGCQIWKSNEMSRVWFESKCDKNVLPGAQQSIELWNECFCQCRRRRRRRCCVCSVHCVVHICTLQI